jgi:hypothetical protein
VSREMCRNRGERGYRFKQAEAKAQARQAIRSKARKLTAPMRRKIEAKLRQKRWSPEQISARQIRQRANDLGQRNRLVIIWLTLQNCQILGISADRRKCDPRDPPRRYFCSPPFCKEGLNPN